MQGGHPVVGGGVVHRVLMTPRATRVGPHPTRERSGAVEDDDVEVEVRSTSSASSTTVVAVTVLIGGWSESHPPALRREPLDGEVRVTDVNHCFGLLRPLFRDECRIFAETDALRDGMVNVSADGFSSGCLGDPARERGVSGAATTGDVKLGRRQCA
jgi:hypothetical protein